MRRVIASPNIEVGESMKIGLYGSAVFCQVQDPSIPFIAIDGGLAHLQKLHIQPILAIGDFDSLQNWQLLDGIPYEVLPKMKDDTDLEVAIKRAIEKGYDDIEVYGVTGKRLDHFIVALRLLVRYRQVKITLYDDFNQISLLKSGQHDISKNEYPYISFFSVQEAILTLQNVRYPLDHYHLKYEDGLCVSNEILERAYVENVGDIIMIRSRDTFK